MSQPNWTNQTSFLGTYPSGFGISVRIRAFPVAPALSVTYKILNGLLPVGTSLSTDGYITGTLTNLAEQTDYTFTVRAMDNIGNIRDKTFSMSIYGFNNVRITTLNGQLLNIVDSVYVNYQIQVNNPVEDNYYVISLSAGLLPPGLYLSDSGQITGYPLPPISLNGAPTTTTYTFSVQLSSLLGTDTKTYSIVVRNQQINNAANTRIPAILNDAPLNNIVSEEDPFYAYYLTDTNIPNITSGEYFSFKIVGHDFDRNDIIYQYGVLPPGLVGDINTGWIYGTPTTSSNSISKYTFSVCVAKARNTSIVSPFKYFSITVENGITPDIVWETEADLGTINNGSISELFVKANSVNGVEYKLISGTLPTNTSLLSNGQIVGRIPFQPSRNGILPTNTITTYSFIIEAFNPRYPLVNAIREFTVNVLQKFSNPVQNLYFKATPDLNGRRIIQSLLTNEELIPTNYLYRSADPYFGKASNVKFTFKYGVVPANIETYINTVQENFYFRNITLGELKTAIARDEDNNILYEVVYSEIVDDLITPSNQTLPQQVVWPTVINLFNNDDYTTNTELFTSFSDVFTSNSPGETTAVYPASITNMSEKIKNDIPFSTDQSLLPKWMTSQQENGSTLGFIRAWVLCYTLPGRSEQIKNTINNGWQYKLNQIDFSIDRFIIDRSATFNYDLNLEIPSWTDLPSGMPTPLDIDFYDLPILFPRKTILPKNLEQ